jgi:ABC-type transport system involved in cytochrome c biogenesis permease component
MFQVSSITTAVVVMTRKDGMLLALPVPELPLFTEVLSAGLHAGPTAMVGSTKVEVHPSSSLMNNIDPLSYVCWGGPLLCPAVV